jgi:WD repeat-containing protein 26
VGILSSAFHLRERLAQILFLFRENAADIFPRKVNRQPRESSLVNPNVRKQHRRKQKSAKTHYLKPTVDDSLDPENFPEQIEQLAIDVTTFLNCLNEFPEFTDEAVNASILSFEGDLKVRERMGVYYVQLHILRIFRCSIGPRV